MRRELVVMGLLPAAALPAQAQASTHIRFAHAIPGAGRGELDAVTAGHRRALAHALFAHVTSYHALHAGPTKLVLRAGGKTVATVQARLRDGTRYTVVALAPASGLLLKVFPDGQARPRVARVRVIHAAPELGSPDLRFDGQVVVHGFGFGQATPYLSVRPGRHSASAAVSGMPPVVAVRGVLLSAGTASTAFVMGSRGQPVRVVLTQDAKVSHGAPHRPAHRSQRHGEKHRHNGGGSSIHVVRHGESLWLIAKRVVGPNASNARVWGEVLRIWNANASKVASEDPNTIVSGLRLRIP